MKQTMKFFAMFFCYVLCIGAFTSCGDDEEDMDNEIGQPQNNYDLTQMTDTEVMKALAGKWKVTAKYRGWGYTGYETDLNGTETWLDVWDVRYDEGEISISGSRVEESMNVNGVSIYTDEGKKWFSHEDIGYLESLSPNSFVIKSSEGDDRSSYSSGFELIYTGVRIAADEDPQREATEKIISTLVGNWDVTVQYPDSPDYNVKRVWNISREVGGLYIDGGYDDDYEIGFVTVDGLNSYIEKLGTIESLEKNAFKIVEKYDGEEYVIYTGKRK